MLFGPFGIGGEASCVVLPRAQEKLPERPLGWWLGSLFGSKGCRGLGEGVASLGLSHLAAFSLGGFLVVAGPLHFAGEAFALAKALETFEHLLDGFVASGSDFDHVGFALRTAKKGLMLRSAIDTGFGAEHGSMQTDERGILS